MKRTFSCLSILLLTLAADAVHQAFVEKDFSPERFSDYATMLRQGVENMRKLVYAFYEPAFSFKAMKLRLGGLKEWAHTRRLGIACAL